MASFAGSDVDPDFNVAFADILLDFVIAALATAGDEATFFDGAVAMGGDAADFACAGLSIFAGSFAGVAVFFIAFAMDQHKKLLVASSRSVRRN